MPPETSLVILTTFADFLLKLTFASGISWSMSQLVTGANRRFAIWFCFLAGAGMYWIWKLSAFLKQAEISAPSDVATTYPTSIWNRFYLPGAWSSQVSMAVRVVICAYVIMLVYFLVLYVRKYMHLRRILGFTWAPPEKIRESFVSLTQDFGLRNCELLMLSGIASPATIGWVRPVVLLPALCTGLDEAETEDILRHELHHIRRRDFLLSRIADFFQALLFFHPVAWYARRQLEFERELACDLAVVASSPNRRLEYAECLVSFARSNEARIFDRGESISL